MELLSITFCKQIVLLGALNRVRDNSQLQIFCESFLFEHLIKKPIGYKDDTPTVLDHIITNISKRFMKSMALGTGISKHHKIFNYRCHKKFSLEQFQMGLKDKKDVISYHSFDLFLEEFKTS